MTNNRKKAIIIDLDGTLVDNAGIDHGIDGSSMTPDEWDAFNMKSKDAPANRWCLEIIKSMGENVEIIFLTARHGSAPIYAMTAQWLYTHLPYKQHKLFMRDKKDSRPDYIFKEDIYLKMIEPHYDVIFAVDDKRVICDMWRKLGVTALHCEDY